MLLYQPIISALIFFYRLSGNLGLAIIILTVVIRLLLLPLTLPGMQAATKIQLLAPQLEKLKKKYAKNKQKLAQAQMALYRQHKINPAAGCLPQIIQIVILITLYRVFSDILIRTEPGEVIATINAIVYPFLRLPVDAVLNNRFFYLDLAKPDLIPLAGKSFPGFFLWLAVITQFLAAKITLPAVKKGEKVVKKTPQKSDDFSMMMQKQSLYMFPMMTLFLGFNFPSGLVIYWAVFSLINLAQQWLLRKKNLLVKKKEK